MKKNLLIFLLGMFLTACGMVGGKDASAPRNETGGAKPHVGETVVFKWNGANYSEGKIEKIDGNKYEIRSGDYIAKPDAADVYAMPKTGARADDKTVDFVAVYSNNLYWAGGEVKAVSDSIIEVEPAPGNKI